MKIKIFYVLIGPLTAGVLAGLLFYSTAGFNTITATSNPNHQKGIPGSNYFFETFTGDDLKIGNISLFSSCDEVIKF